MNRLQTRLSNLEAQIPQGMMICLRKYADEVQLYSLPYTGYHRGVTAVIPFSEYIANKSAILKDYYVFIPPTEETLIISFQEYEDNEEEYAQYGFDRIIKCGSVKQAEKLFNVLFKGETHE